MNKKATSTIIIIAAKEEYQKRGYPATEVDHIIKRAKVSKEEFDEQFSSLEDCCLKVLKNHAQEMKRTSRNMMKMTIVGKGSVCFSMIYTKMLKVFLMRGIRFSIFIMM
jgi:AcrR family transcriptional regulator